MLEGGGGAREKGGMLKGGGGGMARSKVWRCDSCAWFILNLVCVFAQLSSFFSPRVSIGLIFPFSVS